MRKYIIEAVSLIEDAATVESDCNDITFTNFGAADLVVDDVITLTTGQQRVITGNQDEINVTRHKYRFSGAGTRIATVERKKYVG